MKGKTFSGYYVWFQIQQLKDEMNELEIAMCEVIKDSLAYTLLKKEHEKRKQEWDRLQKTKYIISEE